jgi:hypothetical protein
MVDGRVLPPAEADGLRAAIYDFVRKEALPALAARDPDCALRLHKKVASFEPWTKISLVEELPALIAALETKYPPPAPATWPVLEQLRAFATRALTLCSLNPPATSSAFVKTVKEEGGALPDELVALLGAHDGFDLNSASVPSGAGWTLPVFSLLSAAELEVMDAGHGYPRRVAAFHGGDEVQLCVFRDSKKAWWLSYDYEYEPVAKLPLDLPALLDVGLKRAEARSQESLNADLSWETYFRTS